MEGLATTVSRSITPPDIVAQLPDTSNIWRFGSQSSGNQSMRGLVWVSAGAVFLGLVHSRIHPLEGTRGRYLAGSSAGSAEVSMKMEYSMWETGWTWCPRLLSASAIRDSPNTSSQTLNLVHTGRVKQDQGQLRSTPSVTIHLAFNMLDCGLPGASFS